jgi:hypothetical protein
MGKFSQKMMGKEVGSASVYAEPHTMDGKKFGAEVHAATKGVVVDPNTLASKSVNPATPAMRVSIGDPGRNNVKTTGVETRGNGAATKGRMARGPMC